MHFYLLKSSSRWEDIPILQAQLLDGRGGPFPHAALEIQTDGLDDQDCTLCFWNSAVSRPKVPGDCEGGNWTRGTDPARILEVWRLFREQRPECG